MLGLVADRTYGPFLVGRTVSTTAIWMHNILAAVLAYQITGSTVPVALVSVAQFAPQIVLAPLSGAMADRGNRRRQVVVGRWVSAAGSGGLAAYIALVGADNMSHVWPVVLSSGTVGIGFVIGGPAMNALIPAMVGPEEVASAVILSSVPSTLARAAGPAIGTAIALTAGPQVSFGIAAIGHVIFALVMIWIPISGAVRVRATDSSVRAGFRHLRVDASLILLLLGVAAVGAGADPSITLTPALSEQLHRHTDLVGLFASCFGIGAGLGFLLLPVVQRWASTSVIATLGLFQLGAGCLLLALPVTPALLAFLFAVVGIGMTFALTTLSAQIQSRVPEHLRGRIMALWSVAFLGSRPIIALINGTIADHVGVRVALLVTGAVVLATCWLCRPARIRPYQFTEG